MNPLDAILCMSKLNVVESETVKTFYALLGPFNHHNMSNNEETMSEAFEDEDGEVEEEVNENQCHLCRTHLQTKHYLYDHVQGNHEDYFQGMMEVAARMKNSLI